MLPVNQNSLKSLRVSTFSISMKVFKILGPNLYLFKLMFGVELSMERWV